MSIYRHFKGTIPQGRSELYPQYRGQWEAVPYDIADFVLYGNSVYVANAPTTSGDIPGISKVWEIVLSDGGLMQELDISINRTEELKREVERLQNLSNQILDKSTQDIETAKQEWGAIKRDTAQSNAQATAAAGLIAWTAGDHTTISGNDGYYRVMSGTEVGQVWQKSGTTLTRRTELESLPASRLREYGINILDYSHYVVNGDWIPAINAALAEGDVYIPLGTFEIKPTATNFIKLPKGQSRTIRGQGAGSKLRVADGTGDYQTVIGQANNSDQLGHITICDFTIDQNTDNNVGTVRTALGAAQNAISLTKVESAVVERMRIDVATGINTIAMQAAFSRDIVVRDNIIVWGKRVANAEFDNSAIYVHSLAHQVTGNQILARTLADGTMQYAGWGAIETHGALSVVAHNVIQDFRDGINITPFSGSATEIHTSSIIVTDNVISGGAIGCRVWPITGRTMRNVRISGNTIALKQSNWPTMLSPIGIGMNYAVNGSLDGDIDGLYVHDNDVTFETTELRTNLAYSSMGGIAVNHNGNARNVFIANNTVVNAPFASYVLGRIGKTLQHIALWDNRSINTGTATGQTAQSVLRVPLAVYGVLKNTWVSGLEVIEDTASAQATKLIYSGLETGSDVEIRNMRVTSPNNATMTNNTLWDAIAMVRYYPTLRTRTSEVNVTVPALAAGETKDVDVRVKMIRNDNIINVTGGPRGAPALGYTFSPPWYAGFDGTTSEMLVRIRFANPTSTAYGGGTQTWRLTYSD